MSDILEQYYLKFEIKHGMPMTECECYYHILATLLSFTLLVENVDIIVEGANKVLRNEPFENFAIEIVDVIFIDKEVVLRLDDDDNMTDIIPLEDFVKILHEWKSFLLEVSKPDNSGLFR